jgi:hypothetical protein
VDPFILLIIVFIVAPLIERLLKAGKGQEPPEQGPGQRLPPGQRPSQRLPQQRGPDRPPQRQQPAGRPADEQAAAEMLPDDLWEILTGERRAPRQPVPEPVEEVGYADTYSVEDYPDDDDSLEELAARDVPSADEWMAEPVPEQVVIVPEPYVRPIPKRDVPRVVSLEELEIDSDERHDDFHDKLDRMAAAERAGRRPPNAFRFTKDDDLRNAIIMSEVLGPPKGLEDPHASPERRGW